MTPPNEELTLLVLPTVSVLAPRATEPAEPLRAPSVWLAPRLSVAPEEMVTLASEPRAVALLEFNVPAVRLIAVPLTRLVAALPRVSAPAPDLVIVRATPPSLSAPRVSVPVPVPLLATMKVAFPVNVVLPNVRPYAELLLTLLPAATESVLVPMESVPRVWVTPAPEVSRSLMIVEFAETVVLRPKFSPVLLASARVPPASVSAPAPSALAFVLARSVPALTVVVPV